GLETAEPGAGRGGAGAVTVARGCGQRTSTGSSTTSRTRAIAWWMSGSRRGHRETDQPRTTAGFGAGARVGGQERAAHRGRRDRRAVPAAVAALDPRGVVGALRERTRGAGAGGLGRARAAVDHRGGARAPEGRARPRVAAGREELARVQGA